MTPARRISWVLLVTASASVVAELTLVTGRQAFAAFGAVKRVLLPTVYLLAVIALLLPRRRAAGSEGARSVADPLRPVVPITAWMVLPLVGITVSFVVNLFMPHPHSLTDTLQGLALFAGFFLLALLGLSSGPWWPADRSRLVLLLYGTAIVDGLVFRSPGLTPTLTLVVPAAFAALVFTASGRSHRLLWLAITALMAYLVTRVLQPNPAIPTSLALLGEISICAALTLVWFLPRAIRVPVVVTGIVGGAVLFFRQGGPALLSGHSTSTDVTIAHRSYEAGQVLAEWHASGWSFLFGLGPGGTVNLVDSPDARTLLAASRNLLAVDDVHLLSAYLVLKLGLVGVIWAVILTLALGRVTFVVLLARRRDPFAYALLLLVLAGVVNSLPAATDLLSNVLVPLLLGVLWTRVARRTDPFDPTGSMTTGGRRFVDQLELSGDR